MASIFKPKGSKKYIILYHDENGERRKKTGSTDKAVTERLARDLENRVILRREGLIDPKDEGYRDHATRPLSEHLDAWRDTLLHEGSTPKHADQTADRVRRLIAVVFGARPNDVDGKTMSRARQEEARKMIGRLVDKARLSDIGTERVQAALATFRDSGRSAQTCNHYRAGIRAFARWAKRTGRLRDYPLDGLTGFNAKEDRRHDRRTLSLDELTRLIAVAERGPDFQAMTGSARALCYRLAASTGLRYSEIASVRPGSFDWNAPSVTVEAAYTKNGDPATLPIPSDLPADLRPYVATLAADSPVFPLPAKGVDMLRVDLEAAGIPYVDASGLFFDFHALRCQTATLADAAGVSPRVVQRLMRHSSLELTGRYTKPRAVDIEAAASMLPSLKPGSKRPEAAVMTGTDLIPMFGSTATENATDPEDNGPKPFGGMPVASSRHRSTEPKVIGSNPIGCICKSSARKDLWRALLSHHPTGSPGSISCSRPVGELGPPRTPGPRRPRLLPGGGSPRIPA
jgi:integrase